MNDEKIVSAGIIIINPEKGEFLICHPTNIYAKRDNKPEFPERGWGLPKGQLDPGEDSKAAAVREVEEETGIKIPENEIELLGKYNYNWDKDIVLYAFSTEDVDKYVKQAHCESTFEKWEKTWYEVDNFSSYTWNGENKNKLSRPTEKMLTEVFKDYPELAK